MKEKEFKDYLKDIILQKKETIASRISNLKRIEKAYGDLDEHYDKDTFKYLLHEFTIEKGEDKKHQIEIKGNTYTGIATLKSALGLYLDFKIYEIENQNIKIETKSSANNLSINYKEQIQSVLSQFKYTKKEYSKNVGLLQANILEALEQKIPSLDWEIEKQISDKYKDAVDILGFDKSTDTYIVIELDTTRADQVAKKFTSRHALMADKNILYVSICYPGTKKMSVNECAKYFEYCSEITQLLNSKDCKKEYLGYFI